MQVLALVFLLVYLEVTIPSAILAPLKVGILKSEMPLTWSFLGYQS